MIGLRNDRNSAYRDSSCVERAIVVMFLTDTSIIIPKERVALRDVCDDIANNLIGVAIFTNAFYPIMRYNLFDNH